MDPLLAFISGVGVTLAGVLASSMTQRHNDKHRVLEKAKFQVYMRLLEIDSCYFWVASYETRGEQIPQDIWDKLSALSWKVLDQLRETDEVAYLEEVVEVLLSENYPNANARADALSSLIDRYGNKVNPRYMKAIRRISRENQHKLFSSEGFASNAPGSPILWKRLEAMKQNSN
jgi:hypothetical protein